MSSTAISVGNLFQSAKDQGALSPAAMTALATIDIGQDIQNALGTPADSVDASSVILVNVLVDDSGSIRFASNTEPVRMGVNLIAEALLETKQHDGILQTISYLNGQIICPFVPLKDVPKLDTNNYNPMGGTPLYDQFLVTLGTTVAKTQEFSDNGVPVRSITVVVTDGQDEGSLKAVAKDCSHVVSSMLNSECHIVAAIGFDNKSCDFHKVFKEMGIPDNWIMVVDVSDPATAKHNIRKAFQTVSQSVVRASQSPQTFSQTALGGFGTP